MAARGGRTQRRHQPAGFRAQLRLRFDQAADLFRQGGISAGAGLFQLLDFAIHLFERGANGSDQLGDGLPPQLERPAGGLLRPRQRGAGQFQESLVVAGQRIGRKRFERVRKLLPGLLQKG